MTSLKIAYLFQNINFHFAESFAVQLHICHQINALQQRDHRVSLVALQGRKVLCTDDLSAIRHNQIQSNHFGRSGLTGAKPYHLLESGTRRVQTALHLPYFALFDSHRMYEACLTNLHGYDILHERINLLSLGGALASNKLGIPYILEVNADEIAERDFMGTAERGIRRKYATWTNRTCFETAQRIICVSTCLKQHLIDKWALDDSKIVVLPNAADTDAIGREFDTKTIRHQLGLANELVILFIGGFYPWHDLKLLVESFANVLGAVPEARLVLVGDGETKPGIVHKIKERGLEKSIIMTGALDHYHVPEILAIADILVAPTIPFFSGYGGSPLKLFEYMAAGKAIIASRTGQVAEVVKHNNNGLLVEPGDTEGFSQAMFHLIKDPIERARLGRNARQQAVEQHSWDRYAGNLEQIYLGVL